MGKTAKIFRGLLLLAALILFVFSESARAADEPVISQFFAAQELVSGETWKIYLKASSPAADMKYIYATVEQKGGPPYPVSLTRIKKGNERTLSGYLYLNTFSDDGGSNLYPLNLTVQIVDERGRFSNPVAFPLLFKWHASKPEPPAGAFEEKDLGPIMIRLRQLPENGDNSYTAN